MNGIRLGGDFTRLWIATGVSNLGTGVTRIALPLVALLVLQATTFQIGVIAAAAEASWLLFGLSAGVWIEQMMRRRLLIVCDVLRAVAVLSVPVAYWTGGLSIVQLVALALVVGVCTVFFDIANQTYLPSILTHDRLLAGNSRLQVAESGAAAAGPVVGGALVTVLGAPLALLVDVGSYLVSIVCLGTVRGAEPARPAVDRRPPMLAQIKEGLAYVVADPVMRRLVVVAAGINFLIAGVEVLTVPFLLRDVGVLPVVIGVLVAIGGIGAVIGAAAGGAVAARLGGTRTLLLAASLAPLFVLLVPATSAGLGLVFFAVGSIGAEICIATVSLLARTYRQMSAPSDLLARVTASIKFLSWGALPLGALAAGAVGQLVGPRAALVAIGVAFLLTPLPIIASPLRGRRQFETPSEETSP